VLALWAAITMFVLPIGKGLNVRAVEPRTAAHTARVPAWSLSVRWPLFLLFVLSVPMPLRTHAEGVVWVPENAEVRAAADGFVEQLLVQPESAVEVGDLLLATAEPTLAPRSSRARARVRQLEVQYTTLMFDERTQAAATRRICAGKEVRWRAPKRNSIRCWSSPPFPACSSWRGRRICRSAS
jgi:putative peptide zinc metalloprotease protein